MTPSAISWLDADEEASDQARRLIAATNEPEGGTLDELGLGGIRDTCSDQLFPGTSTLWRRARYLILVPWSYAGGDPRAVQRRLRKALVDQPDHPREIGIIGAEKDVNRLPDEMVWNGLAVWGIRLGEINRRDAAVAGRRSSSRDADSIDLEIWHPRLPKRPDRFPAEQGIRLESAEAAFLHGLLQSDPILDPRDRHGSRRRASRLPLMLDEELNQEWDWRETPERASEWLTAWTEDAGRFADVAWSARALYGLMVAEAADGDVDQFRIRLREAEAQVRQGREARKLARWDPSRLEAAVIDARPRTKLALRFVRDWLDLLRDEGGPLESSARARELVVERERRVKGPRRRLGVEGSDLSPSDTVAPAWPYDFRAGVARSVVVDIQNGLA
jgi:hypothetical protein